MTALAYRPAGPDDLHFVEETFLDSFRLAHAAGLIAVDDWREVMTKQWRRMAERAAVSIIVACHPEERDPRADLYGWAAVETGAPPFLLYAYVKHPYRRMGIMLGLLAMAGLGRDSEFEFAAKTPAVSKLAHKFPRASWNPLRARFSPKD